MIEALAQLTRSMRAPLAGAESARHRGGAAHRLPQGRLEAARGSWSTPGPPIRKHFDLLALAVFTGKTYSDVADKDYVAAMNGATRTLWDGACTFDLEVTA
jgi:hypothetical protein